MFLSRTCPTFRPTLTVCCCPKCVSMGMCAFACVFVCLCVCAGVRFVWIRVLDITQPGTNGAAICVSVISSTRIHIAGSSLSGEREECVLTPITHTRSFSHPISLSPSFVLKAPKCLVFYYLWLKTVLVTPLRSRTMM